MNVLTAPPWLLLIQRIAVIAVVLGAWQLVILSGALPSMLPGVGPILESVLTTMTSSEFWAAVGRTLSGALAGWALASVVGVVCGLLIGSIRSFDRPTAFLIDFGRSFPTLALMPVVIMLLGANMLMQIVVVFLSCVWPILVQTIDGAKRQEAAVADTVAVYQIPTLLRFHRVLLPSALPFIVTGVRISASISLLVAVGIEVISQVQGVGRGITLMQQSQQWDVAFAYLFFTGLIGWGLAVLLQKAEDHMLKWKRQQA